MDDLFSTGVSGPVHVQIRSRDCNAYRTPFPQLLFSGALGDIPGQIAALRSPDTAGDSVEDTSAPVSPDSAVPYGNFVEEYLELLLDRALEAPGDSRDAFPDNHAVSGGGIPVDSKGKDFEDGSGGGEEADGTESAGSVGPTRRASTYANGHIRETVLLVWRSYLIQLRTPELFAVRLILVSSTTQDLRLIPLCRFFQPLL